ncbi:ATP-dependent helicase [Macrococcoides bohemicum]|uniref:UvrD-helicase domain-containing protein n=1 Tax=Macrococcoides bohemicum TaxID=1903056 RepID=UPI001059E750|nr:ATP-dependent helicase [Macrococcus bohemicus]TDL33482.1 ATP-dependent helicase [Macrococcus bohemicus]
MGAMKVNNPTEEQQEIIEKNANIVVTAKPGSGKTYTIIEKILNISESLLDYQGVIAISFTRKASQELELRYKKKKEKNNNHFFGTIDKFYITEIIIPFAKSFYKSKSPENWNIYDTVNDHPEYADLKKLDANNRDEQLIQLLKKSLQEGLIFLEISGEIALLILDEVPQCLNYLKARYTHIFIDEYQDCGEIQHIIFLRLVSNGILGVAVGDLDQAIYAFSQRYSRYLLSLIKNDQFSHCEITHNHRCHPSISNYSLELMGISKQEISDEKRVFKVNIDGAEQNITRAIENHIDEIKEAFNITKNSDFAILCRSNATAERVSKFISIDNKLFTDTKLDKKNGDWAKLFNETLISYYLFRNDEITKIEFIDQYIDEDLYQKDFIRGLKLVDSIFSLEEDLLIKGLDYFIKLAQLIYPGKRDELIVNDLIDILHNKTKLYSFKPPSENEINIMTLHKSKGLEFKCVFLMDVYKYILPPYEKYGSSDEIVQSLNLHYVGITRAIEVCYIMSGTMRYRNWNKDYVKALESPFLYLNNVRNLRNQLNWN